MRAATPLATYDATGVLVTRGAFCDAIDDRQVSAALDGDAADSLAWENGDTIDLGNGVEDVAHEFGCRYTAEDGAIAQAWVFAPPVDAAGAPAPDEGRRQGDRLRGRQRTGVRRPDAGADMHHQGRCGAGVVPRPVRRRVAGLRGRAAGRGRMGCGRSSRSLVRGGAGGGWIPRGRVMPAAQLHPQVVRGDRVASLKCYIMPSCHYLAGAADSQFFPSSCSSPSPSCSAPSAPRRGGLTKGTVKKIAAKVVNKQAPTLSVKHAVTADTALTATTASNAATPTRWPARPRRSSGFGPSSSPCRRVRSTPP